ncbi:DUF4276 family protein [Nodularia sphaerocarpa]|uniref:DUF4276 family protein n=1 Tax=Nodularia sphaerocarpa TaxID=137816 RepID=UPI001EFBCC7C|nr:DUF4276 family protein [Nodularia sphaerocarpa]MDB9371968.1 DUF4276 family protein [Nodularia sphaerocarpa CS-585]MDB9380415.1 DUF4276 family protein [Nodularia sphaerocarpa CS-585A2]
MFAGGGESEVRGLTIFLEKNFPECQFERKTPVRNKPGGKPNKVHSYGKTGKSLIEQIKLELPIALKHQPNKCDLILVFDDLDCRNPIQEKEKFLAAISTIPTAINIKKNVGFAAPELEAWIIADWGNSVARHPDFRGRHQAMFYWLSTVKNIPFNHPESFSEYDIEKDCCQEKLSQALVDSSVIPEFNHNLEPFSKGLHTPALLADIDPDVVQRKCPLFRELYNYLNDFCRSS